MHSTYILEKTLGPFPQEAREQHMMLSGYPVGAQVTTPLNYTKAYPSHLADGGYVSWNDVSLSDRINSTMSDTWIYDSAKYRISFPDIRWESIRATEGWAGLQHHVLLHTTITIDPPRRDNSERIRPIYLLLSGIQCSHIAVFDASSPSIVPRWHTGNIYAYSDAPPTRIPLFFDSDGETKNSNSLLEGITLVEGETKKLDVLIGLDYEIRLFGDPLVFSNSTLPTIQADLHVALEFSNSSNDYTAEPVLQDTRLDPYMGTLELSTVCAIIGDPDSHVIPHFVNGLAYGDVLGIEVTSCAHDYWTVEQAKVGSSDEGVDHDLGFSLDIDSPVRLAPSQTRLISLRIKQTSPLPPGIHSLAITLNLISSDSILVDEPGHTLRTYISIVNHDSLWTEITHTEGILTSYTSVSNIPASAVVLPPNSTNLEVTSDTRILLAMHGAGVMHTSPFVAATLPRPAHTWVLIVQGLTPWGLDWREASRADTCSALRALVLRLVGTWNEEDYCTPHDPSVADPHVVEGKRIPVVAIGHSNGGQGALHLASSFPDSIPALIPAAGYTSARLYISTQHSRGAMYADASLQAIMRASLQGQDGDIIAGNLVLSRVHLVHGGDDENVPVWHSRERMALVKSWNPDADINFTEVPEKPHFWPRVFFDEPASSKISELVASPYAALRRQQTPFTFTVVWPSESGSMGGWRVRELTVPGRLARVRVDGTEVFTANVHGLSVNTSRAGLRHGWITIDNQRVELPDISVVWLRRDVQSKWEVVEPFSSYPSGPLSRILTSPTVISIIIPGTPNAYYRSLALRLAHNLSVYLKLDCVILNDKEALANSPLTGSVVVIGGYTNKYGLHVRSSSLQVLPDGTISISDAVYNRSGTAALSLYENHLYMDAVDEAGYERALQAFPLRTGVPGPEWVILGQVCNEKSYGGVYAAGYV
ncbi:hypothetical protein FRC12_007461 [Ceratobasidium sp. 428]|nr:hypothetical protein FRC12_007461 [Ceratobasidium sp. 428]